MAMPVPVVGLCRWMSGITLYAGLLMYAAALAVNFYACILVFIAEVAGWPSTNANLDLSQGSTLQLYGVAVYWVIQTMTSVGYGDMSPSGMLEMGVMCLVMLTGTL
ncbi:cyclic nucleotide-binding domain-containing protein, partial [Haematococcus lacustris]